MIKKLLITPIKKLSNPLGDIYLLAKSKNNIKKDIKECYLTELHPNKIKAWKNHLKHEQNLIVMHGKINLVVFDNRNKKNTLKNYKIDAKKKLKLVKIPNNVWFGFHNYGKKKVQILNFIEKYHDPKEYKKLPVKNTLIAYQFKKK